MWSLRFSNIYPFPFHTAKALISAFVFSPPGRLTTAERRAAPPPRSRPRPRRPPALPSWRTQDWTCPAAGKRRPTCRWEVKASSWRTKTQSWTPKRINSLVEVTVASWDTVLETEKNKQTKLKVALSRFLQLDVRWGKKRLKQELQKKKVTFSELKHY